MKFSVKNTILLVLMLIAAALGTAMRPTISLADERTPINLSAMVPIAFGSWREEINDIAQVINPQQKSMLDKIYSQTLSRTYLNTQGYRVMLSIAYGKNQSDALQLHKPEICYPAQGFALLNTQHESLNLLGTRISATRVSTNLGRRFEPITYWMVVGDRVVTGGTDKKITELHYALHNRIPDGMLVRISSIDQETSNAYAIQNQFATAMMEAIAPAHRMRFAGGLTDFAAQASQTTSR